MIYIILFVLLGVKLIPFFLDCPSLYFAGQDILIILLLLMMKKADTITRILVSILIGFTSFFVVSEIISIEKAFIASPIITCVIFICLFLSFKGRFAFDKLGNDGYNRLKVQMVVKEPKKMIPLLGAVRFFDPFGSVFFTFMGYKMYFCKNTKKLKLKQFAHNKKYKYFDTQITHDEFFRRYHNMRHEKYNLFKNNCRSIFPNPKDYIKWK